MKHCIHTQGLVIGCQSWRGPRRLSISVPFFYRWDKRLWGSDGRRERKRDTELDDKVSWVCSWAGCDQPTSGERSHMQHSLPFPYSLRLGSTSHPSFPTPPCLPSLVSFSRQAWASLRTQLVKKPPAVREWDRLPTPAFLGFPCGSAGKESTCNAGDLGSTPELGRPPGEGKGYPLQYTHSRTIQSMGSQRIGHKWTTFTFTAGKLSSLWRLKVRTSLRAATMLITVFCINLFYIKGFPGSSASKESTCHAGDPGLIPGSRRSPGEGRGYPLQYS